MKNVLLVAGLVFTTGMYAQKKDEVKSGEIKFAAKEMVVDDNKNVAYVKDASFINSDLTITGADKIIYDKANKELTVTGNFSYSFNGAVQVTPNKEGGSLHYKIGAETVYIN
jgi:lipopolysaccharide assembly outer membrane protein LptD (OstA)